ncbi:universal stress protein [Granulicoccus sp. GXG6511]|uniref:universal stress protein n=1 Tax=Granulicoccus sp. GXG6511 TaxID=3381351 RepID=UPI003D7CD4EA
MTESSERRNLVVVGVDGSEDGLRAVDYGVREAESQGADLLLAHAVDDAVLAGAWGVVYDPNLLEEAGEEAAQEAKKRALSLGFAAERLTTKIYMGNPGAVLTRLSENARTLVVGRRALSGLERLFVGSTSVGVAATAHCPTIMVSAASHRPKTGDIGLIGVGVHTGEPSEECLGYAFAEAAHRGSRLEVIHAFNLPTSFFADRSQRAEREENHAKGAREVLATLVAPFAERYPQVDVTQTVVAAHPVDELNRRSDELDLLVLGVHGSGLPVLSPGATIRAVMAHGHCPLALVREDKR